MSDDEFDSEVLTKAIVTASIREPEPNSNADLNPDVHVVRTQHVDVHTTAESQPGPHIIVTGECQDLADGVMAGDAAANGVAGAGDEPARQTKQIDYPPYEEAEDCSAYDGEARLSNGDIL